LTIIIYVRNIFGLATKESSHPSMMATSRATTFVGLGEQQLRHFKTERKGIDALAPAVAFDVMISVFRRS
jgi:hypothetical protein